MNHRGKRRPLTTAVHLGHPIDQPSQGFLDGPTLAYYLDIHPGTIRNWAHQGLLARQGTSDKGRAIYDLNEAVELAEARLARGPKLR